MVFSFSIKSKILINFVELFDSKTPQRSLHSSFADFIIFINYFHLSFFVCVLLLLAIKSVCLSVCAKSRKTKSQIERKFGILSNSGFRPFGILSNSGLCPFGILSNSGFYPFGILSNSGFCAFGILFFRILSVNDW